MPNPAIVKTPYPDLIRFIVLFTVLIAMLSFTSPHYQRGGPGEDATIEVQKEGKKLHVKAYIPRGITEFELRIESDRNRQITRYTAISPFDVDSIKRRERYNRSNEETWYPVVDVVLEPGMDAVCIFKDSPEGNYVFGGPFYREEKRITKEIILPHHKLEHWENALNVESKEILIESFYLRKTFPVILREFQHSFELLSENWSGKLSLYAEEVGEYRELTSVSIPPVRKEWQATELDNYRGKGITRDRLIASLDLLIEDALRRQNRNTNSPMFGSLFTFYDIEARTYRSSFWTWGGSHCVKMMLDARKLPEIKASRKPEDIVQAARSIGDVYLKYQVREEGHPSQGSFLVIWTRNQSGFTKWVGTSDSGVIIRWALVPLFMATGDSAYLEAAEYWCIKKEELLDSFDILPHYYLYDRDQFADRILDETGWDPEGHAALFEITGKERFRTSAREYMEKHMSVFQREDGLWQRSYHISSKTTNETARMVRGMGWAMEGLLAMNSMYPDTIYLDYAKRMADHLVESQLPSGAWSFVYTLEPQEMGITEKGTAIWSYLFYRLYAATGEKQYLETARKALIWCLEHQYSGPDPEAIGGLAGRTNASMVGMRYFYDATCAYTTGFFGLAVLEELKLNKQ